MITLILVGMTVSGVVGSLLGAKKVAFSMLMSEALSRQQGYKRGEGPLTMKDKIVVGERQIGVLAEYFGLKLPKETLKLTESEWDALLDRLAALSPLMVKDKSKLFWKNKVTEEDLQKVERAKEKFKTIVSELPWHRKY